MQMDRQEISLLLFSVCQGLAGNIPASLLRESVKELADCDEIWQALSVGQSILVDPDRMNALVEATAEVGNKLMPNGLGD